MSQLATDEVHLWVRRTADTEPAADWALLSEAEQARAQRFHFDVHRRDYVASHALLRRALSSCGAGEPQRLEFWANAYGRPELAGHNPRQLRFNLSRTRGVTVCAVARERELGVDVEDLDRPGETLSVCETYFAASEVAALRALPEAKQRARFFDYWTLKEAYLKARGVGLSLPLDQFAFTLGEPIRIEVDPRLNDDASTWGFWQVRPSARELIALCVRRPPEQPLRLTLR